MWRVLDLDKLSEMLQRQKQFEKKVSCAVRTDVVLDFSLRLMCFGFRLIKSPNKDNSIMIEQFLKPQDCQEIQNICEIQIFPGSMRSQADQALSSCDASILQEQLQAAVFIRRRLDRLFLMLASSITSVST